MFVGRNSELRKLENIYQSGKFECVIVHGRWRVGKTSLIREFINEKNAVYYSAQVTAPIESAVNLASSILTFSSIENTTEEEITNFDDAFRLLYDAADSERLILVLDDFQNLVSSCKQISQLICKHIDKHFKSSKLMLIIIGSSQPLMMEQTLDFESPFHGRRTAVIELQPFSFFEIRTFYKEFSPFDIAVIFGVTGGVPRYMGLMDAQLPIEENIMRAVFEPASPLLEEPINILRREIREPAHYNAVLRAIAEGKSKNSEIATAVDLETSACAGYLKNLMAMGIVGKYTPVTEKVGKRTVYDISDHMFRFWYRFVPVNMSFIQAGLTAKIWRDVSNAIPKYMSHVFEDICRQWLISRNESERLPIKFVEIGRWWGYDPVWKMDVELPIVAYAENDSAIFGECVWSDAPAHTDALVSLAERSRLFRFSNRYLYLFSRSGFSDDCADAAQRIGANLVMFE